jgi:ferrochelatase
MSTNSTPQLGDAGQGCFNDTGVNQYDAVLVVSFGGPEGPDDVIPFLENVLRGRNVPRQRMLEVAEHYQHFGGVSPINRQNRELIAALRAELAERGPHLPIYWGNRHWHPLLADTLAQMRADGVKRAIAFFTSAYSSYAGCRQYRENIAAACEALGKDAPLIDKLRVFFNHPGFVEPMVENVRVALEQIPAERRSQAYVVYTAHSIPLSMAESCRYELQLKEACRIVSEELGRGEDPLVYQSRSGPPQQPWLEPDIGDHLRTIAKQGNVRDVVIVPIGFISDHMEVLFDLDTEAKDICTELGINCVRAATVGTHPKFVRMIRDLIVERTTPGCERVALGTLGASHDVCPENCCLPPRRG